MWYQTQQGDRGGTAQGGGRGQGLDQESENGSVKDQTLGSASSIYKSKGSKTC